MTLLLFYLCLALGVSFFCSVLESVLLSITPSYVATLENKNPLLGSELSKFKKDIDRPLAAILSLNTVAHTIGAAGVGAQALIVFGEAYLVAVSIALTLLILVLSEIIPKTLGAIYWRKLTPITIRILKKMIFLLYPLVVLSQKITSMLSKDIKTVSISREEIKYIADIGYKEGSMLEKESILLKNLMRFGSLSAEDIMTPQPVMFTLYAELPLEKIFEKDSNLKFSRIPIYHKDHEDIGFYVLKNDLLMSIANNETGKILDDFKRPLHIIPETASLYNLFDKLLENREAIALAVDGHGGVAGIVTLEDILETLLGIEIVDETDEIIDMQKYARSQWIKRAKKLGLISDTTDLNEWLDREQSKKSLNKLGE